MEITLEKIELVKDRTGVTYKEAKEALEAADGNVVDAIIAIEQTIDQSSGSKFGAQKEALIDKMKEIFKKGNISRILVTRNGDTILNIPLNVGVIGTVVAPWGIIAGTVAAFGFKCTIEFIKDDGFVIDLTEKAGNLYEDAKEKSSDIYEDFKEKAPDMYEDLKEISEEAIAKAKYAAKDVKDKLKKERKGFDDFDIDFDDLDDLEDFDYADLCDKECEECESPCEERCDDCGYEEKEQAEQNR